MGRRPRFDHHGGVHHVINRGVDHQRVFFADADRVEFGRRLDDIYDRFGVETLAYCLLDNHYHLIVRTPRGGLPAAMHHLGLVYTRHTNDRVGRDGPLFRGRYWSNPVVTDTYLLRAVRYVHRNALDIDGVTRADSYRWSSYRTYLGERRIPRFVNTGVVLSLLDGSIEALRRFTDDPVILPDLRSVDDVVHQLRFEIAIDDVIGRDADPHRHGIERTVLALVADRLPAGPLRVAIIDHLAYPTSAARRSALTRARRRASDPRIGQIAANLISMIELRRAA